MTATELAAQDARQKKYDDMLARQQAYEDHFVRQTPRQSQLSTVSCVFAKSCNLPDGVINHESPAGFIPVERLADFGAFSLLGGREKDASGNIPLKKISGADLPSALGTLALGSPAFTGAGASATSSVAAVTGGVAGGALAGMNTKISSLCFLLTPGCSLCMLCSPGQHWAVTSNTTDPHGHCPHSRMPSQSNQKAAFRVEEASEAAGRTGRGEYMNGIAKLALLSCTTNKANTLVNSTTKPVNK